MHMESSMAMAGSGVATPNTAYSALPSVCQWPSFILGSTANRCLRCLHRHRMASSRSETKPALISSVFFSSSVFSSKRTICHSIPVKNFSTVTNIMKLVQANIVLRKQTLLIASACSSDRDNLHGAAAPIPPKGVFG